MFVDDKPVDTANAGSDVKDGVVTINSDRLYNLIDLKGKTEKHILKLEFENSGVEVFAFTFGWVCRLAMITFLRYNSLYERMLEFEVKLQKSKGEKN